MSKSRHDAILNIISKHQISDQRQLSILLKDIGFDVTQSTVSRDIQDLGLIKVTTENDNRPYYTRPLHPDLIKLKPLFERSVISIEGSGQLIVLKTITGAASSACVIVDKLNFNEVMGTIAGDDTVLIILRDANYLNDVILKLKSIVNL
ncbi:MAG: arginine repressor [Christensenellaceae bacterium]|jgi:transcriptional regulator of arginine metabolism|nr:arginine repressor [Christensenellaceae bacterium]